MSKEFYRLCLKSGNFEETPTFKIKYGQTEQQINTYFVQSDKQRYNHDVLLEIPK